MPHREFVEWQAYYMMEPWDETRADWRAGMLAAVIANVNRDKKTPPRKPEEFMPGFEAAQPKTDWRVMRERLRMAGRLAEKQEGKKGRREAVADG